MEYDADEMGVELDWDTIVLKLGDDYEEMWSFRFAGRSPVLEIEVTGERKNDA